MSLISGDESAYSKENVNELEYIQLYITSQLS